MTGDWDDVTQDDFKTIHVVPVRDLREHVVRGTGCWCQPSVERLGPGRELVTHVSLDGRELVGPYGPS